MSDATKRTCGCDWSLWETCDECNPDDEAAEIERLRTRLAESEAQRDLAVNRAKEETERRIAAEAEVGRLTEQDGAMLRNTMEALHAAEAERDELLGALRFVLAHAFEAKWAGDERALELVEAAIAKVGGGEGPTEVERGKCGECGGTGFDPERYTLLCRACGTGREGTK